MDEKQKKRIRAIAKRVHWLVQVVLFVMIVLGFVLPSFMHSVIDREFPDVVAWRLLQDSYMSVVKTVTEDAQLRHLRLFGIRTPASDSELDAWATMIQGQLEQPAAVLVLKQDSILWFGQLRPFAPAAAAAESLILGDITSPKRVLRDTVGQVIRMRVFTDLPDSTTRQIHVFIPTDCGDRWGVITDEIDGWRVLVRAINEYRTGGTFDSRIYWLKNRFQIDGSPDFRHGLRIFLNDTLVFASPDLDTTRLIYKTDTPGPVRWEVYLSKEEQNWVDILTGKYGEATGASLTAAVWMRLGMGLTMVFVLALFYRWILKLTKPETT